MPDSKNNSANLSVGSMSEKKSPNDFLISLNDIKPMPSTQNERAVAVRSIEGELVEDKLVQGIMQAVALQAPTLDEWMSVMDKSPEGLDPVLADFLRANPEYFDPAAEDIDPVSPRRLTQVSQALHQMNDKAQIIESGNVWKAPASTLSAITNKRFVAHLIVFAEAKGLIVETGLKPMRQASLPEQRKDQDPSGPTR